MSLSKRWFVHVLLLLTIILSPWASTQIKAQSQKKLKVTVSQQNCQLKPGGTTMIDVNVEKSNQSDQIEMKIKSTPLMIRTEEDTTDANPMIHHYSLFVTAPAAIPVNNYKVVLTFSDQNRVGKSKLGFNISDIDPNGPVILAVSYDSVSQNLFLDGNNFGSAPKITLNGVDISSTLVSIQPQADGSQAIQLNDSTGNLIKFVSGVNTFLLETGGQTSNTFIFNY